CHPLVHSLFSHHSSLFRFPPSLFFFLNGTPTPVIYTLSLHDALPISAAVDAVGDPLHALRDGRGRAGVSSAGGRAGDRVRATGRSEEHTSELQSHLNLVCRLLLEKKKSKKHNEAL